MGLDRQEKGGGLLEGVAVSVERSALRIETTEAEAVQPIIDGLRRRSCVIRAVRTVRPSLEDLFMEAVIDPTTGAALAPGAVNTGGKDRGNGGAA